MKRRQYLLLVVLTVVAGVIGGAVSNRLFMARAAVAQEVPTVEEVVIAKKFMLLDDKGNLRSIWTMVTEAGLDDVCLIFGTVHFPKE